MTGAPNQVLLRADRLVGPDLGAWLSAGGGVGLERALADPTGVMALLERADLRGMGGAGFPTHRKWAAVAGQGDAVGKILVCNGNEDEPGTFKDRLLLEKTPHQVIEGALIAAAACAIDHIAFYINPHEANAIEAMGSAVEGWRRHPLLARLEAQLGRPLTLKVVISSGLYIGGEETAAIASVDGGFPFPRRKPPWPAEQGVGGRPTLVNNVETLANLPHIVREGAPWYRDLGIGAATGTKIYSLSGDVLKPGAYELPMGTSLRELIFAHGGGMLQGKAFKAVFTGGPSNTLLTRGDLDVALDFDSVRARHSRLGTGAMIVISEGTDIVKRVTEYTDFFAHSSCGQCPPCKIGTHQMSRLLRRISEGQGTRADLDALVNLCKILPGSGRCGLIDGAATVLDSSLYHFMAEYEAHLRS
jgi:NADH-quinone oxidoreductase subunit F